MGRQLVPALRLTLFLTLLTGVLYPLAVTGLCQTLFPRQANGSLIQAHGHVIGSELIAQRFTRAEYFQPRPSAANYDGAGSGGSNLGPTSRALMDRLSLASREFRAANPGFSGEIPADLLTASASGLDPHLSPAAAQAQAARVAQARGAAPAALSVLIGLHTEMPDFGLIGEPRVNILRLNLELDRSFPVKH